MCVFLYMKHCITFYLYSVDSVERDRLWTLDSRRRGGFNIERSNTSSFKHFHTAGCVGRGQGRNHRGTLGNEPPPLLFFFGGGWGGVTKEYIETIKTDKTLNLKNLYKLPLVSICFKFFNILQKNTKKDIKEYDLIFFGVETFASNIFFSCF